MYREPWVQPMVGASVIIPTTPTGVEQILTRFLIQILLVLTLSLVAWADVFTRKSCRDFILENLTYSRKEKGLYLYGYMIMSNHIHLVVQQKDGKLAD
jgi:hypothetical protein